MLELQNHKAVYSSTLESRGIFLTANLEGLICSVFKSILLVKFSVFSEQIKSQCENSSLLHFMQSGLVQIGDECAQ